LLRVCRTGVGGEVEEQVVYPRSKGRRCLDLDAVRRGFGGGVGEGAAAVVRLREQRAEDVVNGQDPVAWVGVFFDAGGDAFGPRAVPVGEVFADQVVLAGERVVERAFGDPGVLDDPVDADGVDALVVKEDTPLR
jgi:hypothetical protein